MTHAFACCRAQAQTCQQSEPPISPSALAEATVEGVAGGPKRRRAAMPGVVGSVDHLALLSGLTRIGKWLLAQPDCRCSNCGFVPQNRSRGAPSDRGYGLDLSCSRQSATLRPAGRWSGFALAGRRVAATAGWPDRGRFFHYYLRQCVRRPFEPTPRLRSRKGCDNASPERPHGWRIAEQGNRESAACAACLRPLAFASSSRSRKRMLSPAKSIESCAYWIVLTEKLNLEP
jgi:hypothetical protein